MRRLVAGDFFSNEKERGNKTCCEQSLIALMQVFSPHETYLPVFE